ncbi:MAG: phosphoglycerate kinase [Nitrospirota bacterium]|nr:phosphoglycerate kinase [Nitrospirota bacterium]
MKRSVDRLSLKGKRAFIRADFNVPLDDDLNITDDARIRGALPTINYAIDAGAKVILGSHLGRPKGAPDPRLSLAPVARRLGRLLGKEVAFAPDCVGPQVDSMIQRMKDGDVLLLENLRFHKGETANDPAFAKQLAGLAEVYVNDAFGAAHRAHASITGITEYLPEVACGYLMQREINYLHGALNNPVRPLVVIIGGAKVSSKIAVLQNLVERADKVIVGGGMAFTFLRSMGYGVGASAVEEDMLELANKIRLDARSRGKKFYLPVDCVVSTSFSPQAETKIVTTQEIPDGWLALDIGPASVKLFQEAISDAKTVLWNGPMGVFEMDAFSRGTFAVAHAVADTYALTIVGGGDSALAVHRAGESENMSFISTGGGAALELLEGKILPGLAVIPDARD